jgi:hypothetical protein
MGLAGKMWDGLQPAFEAGAHEMASALFRGDAFVMYPRTEKGVEQGPTTMDGLRSAAMEKQQEMQKGMDGPQMNCPERDQGMER